MQPTPDKRFSSIATKAKWPLFLLANVAILLVVGISTIRESYRGWSVDREIRSLEQKAEALEGRKAELTDLAIKMQNPQYIEREARAKLGLQKPGEKVVILEGITATHTTWSVDITTKPPEPEPNLSNPERWWRYFTKSNS